MKLGSTALAIAALGIATPAHAVGYCSGIATNAASYGNGDFIVRVSWRNDWVKVCNLIQAHGNVSPQTCFAWFSVINNSMSYNKTLTVYYPSITDADCATMLTYDAAPVPGYVMMNR